MVQSGVAETTPDPAELIRDLQVREADANTRGDRAAALAVSEQLVKLVAQQFSEDSAAYAGALEILGSNLLAAGHAVEAEPIIVRSLELRRKFLGPEHPATLSTLNNHAAVLDALGRPHEAERLYAQALDLTRTVQGPRHSDTLTAVNNHAVSLLNLGREEEAEPLLADNLQIKRELFGDEDPSTVISLNNYAGFLLAMGRYVDAEPLLSDALRLTRKVLGDRHPDSIISLSNYASVLEKLGRLDRAERSFAQAVELQREILGVRHPATLTTLNNHASALRALGKYHEAEPLMAESLRLRREVSGPEHPDTIGGLNNYALLLDRQGRTAEAEPLFREALRLHQKILGHDHPSTIKSMNNLAGAFDTLDRHKESRDLHEQSLNLLLDRFGPKHPETITSMNNYGRVLKNLGQTEDARKVFAKALNLARETFGRSHPLTLVSLDNYALVLEDLNQYIEAEKFLAESAVHSIELFGRVHRDAVRRVAFLADNRLNQPDRAYRAIDPARDAINSARSLRKTIGFGAREEVRFRRETQGRKSYFNIFADAAWSRGPGLSPVALSAGAKSLEAAAQAQLRNETFLALQDALESAAGQAVAQSAARKAASRVSADLEQLAIRRQTLSDEWVAVDQALVAALATDDDTVATKLTNLRAQAGRLKEEIRTIDGLLLKEAPDYFALIRPEPLSLPEAQDMLAADEAALLLVPSEFGTHVMAVTKDGEGLKWHRSELKAEDIEKAVADLRKGLDQQVNPLSRDYDKAFDRTAAYELYKALIEPVAERLEGKTHVYVAAAGSLTSLPLSVLVTAPPEGEDDDPEALRNTPWLSDQYALVQIPSLQSLQLLRSLQSKKAANDNEAMRPFDGFGDPVLAPVKRAAAGEGDTGFDDLFVRGTRSAEGAGVVDLASLRKLPSLPGTATELKNLRKSLDAPESSIRMQAAATEAAVKDADLSSSRILAFATHGVLAGEITGAAEPGLVFTPPETASDKDDGLLTASEITTLNLNADWVILSACNTASGDGKGAPGFSGLARSFFYAGARNLLASHWPVRDDVASTITVDTIDQQKTNTLSRAQAFQKAMQNIRNDSTDTTKAHPAAWAPFILVGDK